MSNKFIFAKSPVSGIIYKKNIVQPDRSPMTIPSMRIAYWINKATDTHSEYVILTAFPLKHLLA